VLIVLADGPRAGAALTVPDDQWRWLVPVYDDTEWIWAGAFTPTVERVAVYERRRYDPGWLCALPLHRWVFTGWR